MTLAPLRLNKNEDRRLRAGHVWVFSNEVDTKTTPLTGFEPGQPVLIEDAAGRPLGTGYVNPHALICARLVSRDPAYVLDQSLITHRLNIALSLRERLFDAPFYRLAFGDSDNLPGLTVDRYGDIAVAQITTAGMERLKSEIVAALEKVIRPRAILFRNDVPVRELEGLTGYVETALGEVPELVALEEHGVRFEVPLLTGQKTGWFYDQRMNRARLRHYVKGLRVLDVFSYLGAWGIHAAHAGAESVLCVDSSPKAVEGVRRNAELNGLGGKVTVEREDAFEILKRLRAARERFDVVVLDPPAFIKRKKDIKEGTLAYQRLNQMAMQVLAKDGILVSCSCSYHLARDDLKDILLKGSRHIDRFLEFVEEGHQAPDHPVHPAIPETGYLKVFFARLLPN
ncbi:MAG: SAM-dependent methyltransferase [Candidatus Muproteobacteria bacterium RIFCSPHIGHO2_02_FULL_65_16]|uniref:SAM-dependent methyltransferase n=1 Tax=Candidatus Muproteobacteria bacterium RIFCSPHIGHO2_02_FULL_65_16 TaxID=1817766 RepID=A0A1F6TZF2_9PROT|nr:MAG: SAM-dependent methyltransferase [Candidatus Muproteobacteria bacterium RIFCSPHIGHO2_02_FULL_65_16]